MPELILSPGSSSVVSPPPAAFQPTLRILKRPSSAATRSRSSSSSTVETKKTLAEREAEYHAARERIFKDGNASPSVSAATKTLREPKGPDSDTQALTDGRSKGFGKRISKTYPPQIQSRPISDKDAPAAQP